MRILDCDRYRIGGLIILSLLGTHHEVLASTVRTIYNFEGGNLDTPAATLIADAAGNLYGVTISGGGDNDGTVFELSPPTAGDSVWIRKTLYSFRGSAADGGGPKGKLAMDASGNLYGTNYDISNVGNGVIYKLSPPEGGHTVWTEKRLYVFPSKKFQPTYTGLVIDSAGALYGTGATDDYQGDGMIFKLSPPAAGHTVWDLSILHQFTGPDGAFPYYLTVDPSGILYGTTEYGGTNNKGTIYRLTPPTAGHTVWTEKVLYNVAGFTKGSYPAGPVIADSSGTLYGGLTSGTTEPGQIFQLTPPGTGHTVWTERTIFKFSDPNPSAGLGPVGGLAFDRFGAIYGETYRGGANNVGTVFKLTPPATGTGQWSETTLSSLKPAGESSVYGLVSNQNGKIFGVQGYIQSDGRASVFEITP